MRGKPALRIRFWGVRGSFPVPGPRTARIGGNSSCVEVETKSHTVILDAGTGIIGLGEALGKRQPRPPLHIFLSHMHHDHIEGLRFFKPFYQPGWQCNVYGPEDHGHPVQKALAHMMKPRFFPVELGELQAQIKISGLDTSERVELPGRPATRIDALHSRAHPKFGVQVYRVTCGDHSLVYATDVESPLGGYEDVVAFAAGADVLIHDAQYTENEYHRSENNKQGWGHSTVRMAAQVARDAGVKELILFHHDPSRGDTQVPRMEAVARKVFPQSRAAREGLVLRIG